jgi:hypothetical protein
MIKANWNLKVNWVGNEHILLSMQKAEGASAPVEALLSVNEYAEFMQLLQEFNLHFKDKIDEQLIKSYLNE